jgi:nicotinamide-nucleotide amidase
MLAEIISTGDEIVSGQTLDTNSRWLSLRLEELGIRVLRYTAVGDDLEALATLFQCAADRADVIVVTGGLGASPTDLTREALARCSGRRLVLVPEAMEHIRRLFARRKRRMPERNDLQAMFPEGSRVIPNPNGTAPGIDLDLAGEGKPPARLFSLPGVPAEMEEMFAQTVAAELRKMGTGRRMIRHRRINCFGAAETQIIDMLPDLIHRGRDPHVGITAEQATIVLRLSASGATQQECQAAMEPIAAEIRRRLGNLVVGEDDEGLQDAVIRLLRQQGRTLATAEWGTAGLVADWLGGVVGAEGLYLGGIVVAGPAAARRLLDLPADVLPESPDRGTASAQSGAPRPKGPDAGQRLAAGMASACRQRFGADYGLAVGPFPKFDPAASEPEPVFFALASPEDVVTKSMPFAGHPALVKVLCGKIALDVLRRTML